MAEYCTWNQRGDARRKAGYDSGGRDVSDTVIPTGEANLAGMIRALEKQMPHMSARERAMVTMVIGMVAVSLMVSGCVPVDTGATATPDNHNQTPTWSAPTQHEILTPAATVTKEPTLTPTVTKTEAPRVAVCANSAAEMRQQGDMTDVLGNPLTEWKPEEKTKIVDAAGNPIYPDVEKIAKAGAAAGLVPAAVAVGGEKVGGYTVIFEDEKGNMVWPKVKDASGAFVPASRPDANGNITKDQWDVIPKPEYGSMGAWMQRVDGGSCAYVTANLPDGTVAGVYKPITKTWVMDEEAVSAAAESVAEKLGIKCEKCSLKLEEQTSFQSLRDAKGGMMAYFQETTGKWISTVGWKEAAIKRIGDEWSDNMIQGNATDQPIYNFQLVTDGEALTEKYKIMTKEGELLATTRVSVRGFYLDKAGNLQSVIVPQLVELADDKLYLIRTKKYVDWNEAQISEKIKTDPRLFDVGTKGLVMTPVMTPDVQKEIEWLQNKYGSAIPEAVKEYLRIMKVFGESWSRELARFYSDGVSSGDVVVPFSIASGDPTPVFLP